MNPYFKDYYTKRDLKDQFHFTDKRIKEFLGKPDRIEKLKGSTNQSIHLYFKSRVKEVMEHPDYISHAARVSEGASERPAGKFEEKFVEKIKKGRFDRHEVEPRRVIEERKTWGVVRGGRPDASRQEKLAKARLKELVGKLRKDWDLNEYKEFFPLARDMKRKHIFFVGPTNSGKSYRGFNELATASSGIYLAPLRLLALEGQEEIEKRGKECSLLTGEEIDMKEGAQFMASTIEMANLDRQIDCALIDEVQLLLDQNRGWAWSQALVGIPAKTIIMTGSDDCIPTLRRLIEEYLGEELEIIHLERIGKLEVLKKHVGNLAKVEPGSAIIAFSRRAVLAYKKELEDGGRKVSVLYGNLSPGVRREEAKRFRSGETDILVATDCIGMGLNLPIKTVIFSETEKYDGKEVRPLTTQEVKQIAGRAGRYGKFECGYVGVATQGNVSMINQSIHAVHEATLESCCVRPTETQLEVLRDQIGGGSIKSAISLFSQLSKTNSIIVCSDLSEMVGLAERIEATTALANMSFPDKYLFICAPVSATDFVIESYIEWLISYSKNVPVELDEEKYSAYTNNGSTSEDNILNFAENSVKTLTLYHWLSRKRVSHFPSLEKCEEIRDKINTFIENSLKKRGLHRKCPQCARKLPLHHMHKVCDECFRGARRYR
ncbi:MAG: helicase-related protein [Bdellovibrionia bacterium]